MMKRFSTVFSVGPILTQARILLVSMAVLVANCLPALADDKEVLVNTPIKDKWALVIGISEFANPSMNLKYPAKDAKDFRDFLIDKCNFAPDHVRLMTNEQATSARILDVLGDSWLPRVALPDDLVVIFISSHGSPSELDVAGVNYVVAHDTNPQKLFTTAIPIRRLAETIKERVHSDRVLIFLDACHSGAASESGKGLFRSNVDALQLAQGTGQMVVCSSAKNEVSWESKKYANGVFTKTLIDALQKNGTGTKIGDAFSYLKDEVQRQVVQERGVLQTPVLASKWKGDDLVLAAVPTSPRAGLPEVKEEVSPPIRNGSSPLEVQSQHADNRSVVSSGTPQDASSPVPDMSGTFVSNRRVKYQIWQNGRNIGWTLPRVGETCTGVITADNARVEASWDGPYAAKMTGTLMCDKAGRVMRIIGPNGMYMQRVGK